MNRNDAERFCGRTKELADDIYKAYATKIAEYAATGASEWKESEKMQLAVFASAMGVGFIGGTMIAATRMMSGEEAANSVRDVLLASIRYADKP